MRKIIEEGGVKYVETMRVESPTDTVRLLRKATRADIKNDNAAKTVGKNKRR
jgi:hypothetical protein